MKQAKPKISGRKDLPFLHFTVRFFRGLDRGTVGSIGAVQDMLVVREPVPDVSDRRSAERVSNGKS
jgi:hypothetical protein